MKFEKLSENKIKITLTSQDLKDKNIDFHSFMSNPLEKQDLFLDILEEAEEEIGFEFKDYPVRIEALAMANGEFIVTVTRVVPDSKNLHKKVSVKRKNTKIDSKYAIYKFAKNILLYLYKEDYYIVFDNINLKYSNIAKFNSAIIEFAKFISNSSLFICKLLENGEIIMNNNAIKTGIKYFK